MFFYTCKREPGDYTANKEPGGTFLSGVLEKFARLASARRYFSGRADLGNDPPMTAIIRLAIPSIGLFVFNTLLHLVDTIFVSWLGEMQMAAMSFTGPINMCIFAMLDCVASGSLALMGRNLGRGDLRSARHIATSGLWLLYAACVLSAPMVLPPVSNAMFSAIGAGGSRELLRLCWLYNMWVPIMLPFMGFTYMANTAFRAQGDTVTPFKSVTIANAINIALDPILIFTFGWGIAGAAIATWVSRVVSSYYLIRKMKNTGSISLSALTPLDHRLIKYWGPILWIGVPVGLTTASTALGMGSVNKILSSFGHNAVAAWMVGLRIEEMAFNFQMGVVTALTPYIAFNYGKRDAGRMIEGFKAALKITFALVGTMAVIIYARPQFFLSIFRPPEEIMALASRSIRASIPGYPFNIFLGMAGGFFVGTGYSIYGTITQIMRSIVFRVSAAWIFSRMFTIYNIWWFQSLAFFLASFVAMWFFLRLKRRITLELSVR